MKLAKIISLLGVIAMGVALIYAFTVGNFQAEDSTLLAMALPEFCPVPVAFLQSDKSV